MSAHLMPLQNNHWYRDERTWIIVWIVQEVWSWTDYLLGKYHFLFINVSIQYPRHNLDHLVILGCLRSATPRGHNYYIGRRPRSPL